MDESALPALGATFAAKYRIDRVLGRGGMGIVYEALHLRLNQRVAIKMLLPQVREHPEVVLRFEREARALATLDSPQIAKVLDVDTSPEGLPYMVIEYLEGRDLRTEIDERLRLPIEEAVRLVIEACVPIALAHARGIVHRDLKPSNLFLANKPGGHTLKLLDFGISKVFQEAGEEKSTGSMQSLGTPEYMSPEQVRQASNVDHRSDVWSLGIILYELLTGTVPFPGAASAVIAAIAADPVTPPRLLRPEIPEALEKAILKALEKDPAKRFEEVRAFATALEPFAAVEELVPIPMVSVATMPKPWVPGLQGLPTDPAPASAEAAPVAIPRPAPLPSFDAPKAEKLTSGSWSTRLPSRRRSRLGTIVIASLAGGAVVFGLMLLLRSPPAVDAPAPTVVGVPLPPASSAHPAPSAHPTAVVATVHSAAPAPRASASAASSSSAKKPAVLAKPPTTKH